MPANNIMQLPRLLVNFSSLFPAHSSNQACHHLQEDGRVHSYLKALAGSTHRLLRVVTVLSSPLPSAVAMVVTKANACALTGPDCHRTKRTRVY